MNDAVRDFQRKTIADYLEVAPDEIPLDAWEAYDGGGFDGLKRWHNEARLSDAMRRLSADAERAWHEGAPSYAPRLTTVMGAGEAVLVDGAITIERNLTWERSFDAITAIGWQLQSWTAQRHDSGKYSVPIITVFAFFTRPAAT